MIERGRRLALFLLAALIALPFVFRGHGQPSSRVLSVASFHFGDHSRKVCVKLEGIPGASGIYHLSPGVSSETVIIMAVGRVPTELQGKPVLHQRLKNGDLVAIKNEKGEPVEITLKSISVGERMVLGIPLDPTTMTESEWELLPGIGPTLAKRIVEYRQQNGGFHAWQELEQVPGIGPATLEKLRGYF
ncbi:ComEA family DNA-binding protein [Geobacter pickeringii]|uniref:Helix-hairpin-helix DNA-binding motif class 1 domain-containing protein n=1 Tax=Geobacter pickeringii TaxID=345632 RepID=A0A0B5BDF8_9BACT|nr:helix-hairpin-helix domain-containing protein [Geobacter pickeringii]AJE03159.1 hypothetical protein GPICK_07090 [Geobacter pickeringii]